MTHIQAVAAVRALLNAGLTIREVAERLQAHPRAVAALVGRADQGSAVVPDRLTFSGAG